MRSLPIHDGRRGGILSGLLVSALIIVCLMIAAGLYVARNVRIESRARSGGADVSIETPAGHLTVRAHDKGGSAAANAALYPGARREATSGGDAFVQWSSNDGDDRGLTFSASEMITSDPVGKVIEYYRTLSPNWVIVHQQNGETTMELNQGGYKRIIAIREHRDGTHIAVASTGEPASN